MLFFIVFIGILFRFIFFNTISFSYDQARDAFEAINIWTSDHLKLLGPSVAEIPGLYHGSLYWYLISPFYFFSNGNPYITKAFLVFINSINIIFIYFFSKKLFQNKLVSYLSAFIFAVSFEQIQYGRWLSNPALAILPIAIFFYAAWQRKIGLMFLAFSFCVQFQLFLIYLAIFFIPVVISMLKSKIKIEKNDLLLTLIGGVLLSPFILAEIKYGFTAAKAIVQFLTGNHSSFVLTDIIRSSQNLTNHLLLNIERSIFSYRPIAILIFLLLIAEVAIKIARKDKMTHKLIFLFIWFISPGLLFFFSKTNTFFTLGNTYPLIILVAFSINDLYPFLRLINLKTALLAVFIFAIFGSNMYLTYKINPQGEMLFAYPNDRHYDDEQKAIDWMYANYEGKMFIVNSVTAPLFANTTWDYVFNYYGKSKYGFLPIWEGFPQNDFAGAKVAYTNKIKNYRGLTFFLIKEPKTAIPQEYFLKYENYENLRSKKIKEINIGGIIIEKRKMINNIHFSRDDLSKI